MENVSNCSNPASTVILASAHNVEIHGSQTMSNSKPYFEWDHLDKTAEVLIQLKPERKIELSSVGSQLSRLTKDEVEHTDRYYPVRFLTDGVAAYYEGFDNAAVFYASMSVELAIDMRIWQYLARLEQAPSASGPARSGAAAKIKQAVDLGVLPEACRPLADRLRKMRNAYVHYRNVLRFEAEAAAEALANLRHFYPALIDELQDSISDQVSLDSAMRDLSRMMTVADEDFNEERGLGPLLAADPNPEAHEFLKDRRVIYLHWIHAAKSISEQIARFEYGAERRDALDSILWASEIVENLAFLPKRPSPQE